MEVTAEVEGWREEGCDVMIIISSHSCHRQGGGRFSAPLSCRDEARGVKASMRETWLGESAGRGAKPPHQGPIHASINRSDRSCRASGSSAVTMPRCQVSSSSLCTALPTARLGSARLIPPSRSPPYPASVLHCAALLPLLHTCIQYPYPTRNQSV